MTKLYLISPPTFELADFRKQLEAALGASEDGFVASFQLRLKDANDAQIIAATKELLPICRAHDVAFIMNDRVDLCLDLGCDGVHVGQEDLSSSRRRPGSTAEPGVGGEMDPGLRRDDGASNAVAIKNIRSQLDENMALGITCHASKHLAMEAAEAGADYVAFGAFYETTSKPMEKLEKWGTPTPDILKWWTTYTEVPCVAIGGINIENTAPLIAAGTDFIAVITAVWEHADGPAAAVRAFQEQVQI